MIAREHKLQDIINSYNRLADDHSLISRYVFRPASFYLTYISLRLGMVKPNHATLLMMFLGIVGSAFYFSGQNCLFWIGTLFYILHSIFDYVDGNIARVTNTATYYGKFLDGVVDVFVLTLIVLSISFGLFIRYQDISLFLSGVSVSLFLLFAFFILNRLSFFTRLIRLDIADGKIGIQTNANHNPNAMKSGRIPLSGIINFTTDFKICILLAASIFGMTKFMFILFLSTLLICAVSIVATSLIEGKAQLNIHRISKMASYRDKPE